MPPHFSLLSRLDTLSKTQPSPTHERETKRGGEVQPAEERQARRTGGIVLALERDASSRPNESHPAPPLPNNLPLPLTPNGITNIRCRWTPGMSEGEETWGLLIDSKGERDEAGGLPSSSTTSTATTASAIREERRMVWDLRPGAAYRFKARARTVFGWSPGGAASDVYNTARRF